jgi:hypothetical protein
MNPKNDELDQYRRTFEQLEPPPEPAPDNLEEPNGDGEEAGNYLNCNHMILGHHIVYGHDNEPSWKCEYCKSNKYD